MTEQERKDLEAAARKLAKAGYSEDESPVQFENCIEDFIEGAKFRDEQCEKRIADIKNKAQTSASTLTNECIKAMNERDESRAECAVLRAALEKIDHTLKHVSEFCLCSRNTKGFDYSEEHPRMGKPKVGARWLTPKDKVDPLRAELAFQSTGSEALDAVKYVETALTAVLENSECRGDEDCDHCVGIQALEKLKKHFGG